MQSDAVNRVTPVTHSITKVDTQARLPLATIYSSVMLMQYSSGQATYDVPKNRLGNPLAIWIKFSDGITLNFK